MAEERTLGMARARETAAAEPSKEALQRRMEEARDSITNTVTEIKENVAQQYENVKDALDWREHFKKQPVAWSLGAAGVGFLVGYGIAATLTGDDYDEEDDYETPTSYSTTSQSYAARSAYTARPVIDESTPSKANGKDGVPGIFKRFQNTPAYDRLSKEAGSLGDRLVEELSTTAQQVVLPALLKKIKTWIGVDLSDKTPSMGTKAESRSTSYEPALGRSTEF
ncbi:MAG: hypothetical protein M3R67_06865 [Acidobacteriota bacterium]|nr:hypothetical protein [Acidobacteriota bacterium]